MRFRHTSVAVRLTIPIQVATSVVSQVDIVLGGGGGAGDQSGEDDLGVHDGEDLGMRDRTTMPSCERSEGPAEREPCTLNRRTEERGEGGCLGVHQLKGAAVHFLIFFVLFFGPAAGLQPFLLSVQCVSLAGVAAYL